MAKNKTSEMPHYELLYIVSNEYSEDELANVVKKVNGIVTVNGGTVTYEESWGKKRLAYRIKNYNHGYYQLLEFDIPAGAVNKVSELLRMSNELLRHMIVSKKKQTNEERKRVIEARQKRIEDEARAKETEDKPVEKETTKKKVDLKDLDDKLDRILDAGDLL